jgi:hypothetical protein
LHAGSLNVSAIENGVKSMAYLTEEELKWKKAIVAACAEMGVEVVIVIRPNDRMNYHWFSRVPSDIPIKEHFRIFTKACVLMDHLRPSTINPSPALQRALDGLLD